ncbi:unnamed protein product [Caenorhabditis sp. 36 PRJEB53466]|nr:unnamed protein product [Caenorhabditis sp. 36 PRJEB53466]
MKRSVARGKKTSCYSMSIAKLASPKVIDSTRYQISAFLYDTKTSQMFGRQCRTEWKRAASDGECVFNETLYFYSVINDKDLLLVLEFVEDGIEHISFPASIGWCQVEVEKKQTAELSDFRTTDVFGGTPNLLIFDKSIVHRVVGRVDFTYKYHEMPCVFTQCLPEFCIVCDADFIPGIQKDDDDQWWLSTPKEMITIPAAIDSIVIQFKNNVPELERQITSDIEREWALKEGNGQKPKAVIMERKLRIGVHNSYTYVTEPFTVDLEIIDENAGGTLRSRKKPIDFGKGANWEENIVFQAAGNPRFPLRNLYADPRMAIVFLLEYTFHREDNQSLNQTILIGWAAWTPFSDGVFSGKEIGTRVCVVGGPRPNPEGVLCYKNVLNQPDSVKPLSEKLEIFVDFKFYENGRSVHNTPTPRRTDSARVSTGRSEASGRKHVKIETPKTSEYYSEDEPQNSHRFPPLLDTGRSVSSPEELKAINSDLNKFIEQPIENPVPQMQETVQKAVEEPRPLTSVYKIPFSDMKPSNFPRSVHSLFAREKFIHLKDRNGTSPITEDVTQKNLVDMRIEQLDRLDTSHIFIQFIAFKQLVSSDSSQHSKLFFTINFFRFPELNTEQMLLTTIEKGEPSLLTRLDRHGNIDDSSGPGFIVKYIIEGDEEKNDFLEFMSNGHACIDVWDADSLIHVGSTIVPLRNLYRKGREAVQLFVQCPIVETALDSGAKACGFLYLRVANVGFPSVNMYAGSEGNGAYVLRLRIRSIRTHIRIHNSKDGSKCSNGCSSRFCSKYSICDSNSSIEGDNSNIRIHNTRIRPDASLFRWILRGCR